LHVHDESLVVVKSTRGVMHGTRSGCALGKETLKITRRHIPRAATKTAPAATSVPLDSFNSPTAPLLFGSSELQLNSTVYMHAQT